MKFQFIPLTLHLPKFYKNHKNPSKNLKILLFYQLCIRQISGGHCDASPPTNIIEPKIKRKALQRFFSTELSMKDIKFSTNLLIFRQISGSHCDATTLFYQSSIRQKSGGHCDASPIEPKIKRKAPQRFLSTEPSFNYLPTNLRQNSGCDRHQPSIINYWLLGWDNEPVPVSLDSRF